MRDSNTFKMVIFSWELRVYDCWQEDWEGKWLDHILYYSRSSRQLLSMLLQKQKKPTGWAKRWVLPTGCGRVSTLDKYCSFRYFLFVKFLACHSLYVDERCTVWQTHRWGRWVWAWGPEVLWSMHGSWSCLLIRITHHPASGVVEQDPQVQRMCGVSRGRKGGNGHIWGWMGCQSAYWKTNIPFKLYSCT